MKGRWKFSTVAQAPTEEKKSLKFTRDWASANATFVSILLRKKRSGRESRCSLFKSLSVCPPLGTQMSLQDYFLFSKVFFVTCAASFFDSLIIQVGHRSGGGHITAQKKFKMGKKISYELGTEKTSIYSRVVCVQDKRRRRSTRRTSLRATGFPRTSVCTQNRPGGARDSKVRVAWILFRSRGDAIIFFLF